MTAVLIWEVVIITILIPALLSASNIFAATPLRLRIPTPMMLSLP